MAFKGRFCRLLFCAMLAINSIGGAPLRPEDVEALMHRMNRPKITHTRPLDPEDEDDVETDR